MKNNIFSSAVLVVICLGNLSAQDSLKVKSYIARKFERDFSGATEVEWTRARRLYVAVFKYQSDVWLAFYDGHGEKLAGGRRIKSIHELPLQVQIGVAQVRRSIEKKHGPIAASFALELMDQGSTRYYIPMQSNGMSVMICSDNDGTVSIAQKNQSISPALLSKDLIARTN
ncbi:MAG TPA: hypothetical protein VK666_19540 [Chryseolinea sp.]|nr:hypothetical protein [Chryseolinea sp.]